MALKTLMLRRDIDRMTEQMNALREKDAEFETREAFDAYQTHPVHMPVKKRMHEVRSASVACDYEINS